MTPFFSIIIPTYNRGAFIAKTISSLLDQDFPDFEIIVVDDGSTDDTEDRVKSIEFSRLRYFKKENGERGKARNFGAQLARGKYINFFDSDDLAYSNHLQSAFAFLNEQAMPPIIHLNYDAKDVDGAIVRKGINSDIHGDIGKLLIRENVLSCNGVFIRKDVADEYKFPEDRRMAASEDWALWLTLGARYPIWHCSAVTSSVVLHDNRSILDWNPDKVIARDTLLMEYLLSDKVFTKAYRKGVARFVADRFTFFMLVTAVKGRKKETIRYGLKAIQAKFSIILSRRFIASIIKLV